MEFVKLPYEMQRVQSALHTKMIPEFLGQPEGYIEVGPEKWILPVKYMEFADKIYNFEARSDDVFICTFPRSGTTWTQEMIWLICNNFDYETAMNVPLGHSFGSRFPFLE